MNTPSPQPDMAWHLRRLLEAVKGTCGLEGRWRWLTGPMVLLMRLCSRRERREAAEAMAAFQGLLETFLGMLEDFRAGRLVAQSAPEVQVEAAAALLQSRSEPAGELAGRRDCAPPTPALGRFMGQTDKGRPTNGADGAVEADSYPSRSRIGSHFCQPVAGPAHRIKFGGKPDFKESDFKTLTARVVRRSTPHPPASSVRFAAQSRKGRGRLAWSVRLPTPHPPASGPIFASKNGNPSRAPPSPARGEGFFLLSAFDGTTAGFQKSARAIAVVRLFCYVIATNSVPPQCSL
jgi:hypothetical protein